MIVESLALSPKYVEPVTLKLPNTSKLVPFGKTAPLRDAVYASNPPTSFLTDCVYAFIEDV